MYMISGRSVGHIIKAESLAPA